MARGNSWSEEETLCLLNIWKEEMIQEHMDDTVRTNAVLRIISELLASSGYERSVEQIRGKMKKLRESFRKADDNNRTSGRECATCRFYNELAQILAGRPKTQPVAVVAAIQLKQSQEHDDKQPCNLAEEQVDELKDDTEDADEDSGSDGGNSTPRTPAELGRQCVNVDIFFT